VLKSSWSLTGATAATRRELEDRCTVAGTTWRIAASETPAPHRPPNPSSQHLKYRRSEKDLQELCSSLATDEEKRRCWEVYRYFAERRSGAQAGCLRELEELGHPGQSCEVRFSVWGGGAHLGLLAIGSSVISTHRFEPMLHTRRSTMCCPASPTPLPPRAGL